MANEERIECQLENDTVLTCNGIGLKNILQAGQQWLEAHLDEINNLNVFPVPDGDTGVNMVLTMRAALAQVEQAPDHTAATVAAAAAQGALMGARGNSGVILSQFWRGLAEGLHGQDTFTAADFARALTLAAERAYQAVLEPVEGTILTVARAAAEAAQQSAATHTDLLTVLADTVAAAKLTQAGTPNLLPVLKEVGVTDSGGQGLVYILEGGLRFLRSEPVNEEYRHLHLHWPQTQVPALWQPHGYGYDVQFLIRGEQLDVAAIRAAIAELGQSTLVVGNAQQVKVHLHTTNPGPPLSYGARLGIISEVVVENLDEQVNAFVRQNRAEPNTTTVIAVAWGPGLVHLFENLGAGRVLTGDRSMNPSVEELLAVIRQVKTDKVLILPNHNNVIPAAQQAQQLADKKVVVTPTQTIPQGIAALLAFNDRLDLEANARRMAEATQQVRTIEVTAATRASKFNGFNIKPDDMLGLLDNQLVNVGRQAEAVALDVLARLNADESEILTIYFGQDSTPDQVEALAAAIRARYPNLTIENYAGGQPHYHYIISLE